MFPIRDHNPSGRTPYVTYALIALNVVVFISYWHLFSDGRAIGRFFYDWGMIPAVVTDGGDLHTFITSMFLHGGIMHLAGNMLFLWIFGDNMEDKMGHVGFLLFYLIAGIGAALAQVIAAPWSLTPMVGASGAIAGVMGSYLLLFPRAKVDIIFIFIVFFKIVPIPAWLSLGVWFALQLYNGAGAAADGAGVAYWAHAGGFIVGVVLTLPIFLRLGGRRFWDQTAGKPPHPKAQYELTRSRIPRVKRR
ncbi:MAG: rhomboid family intramembrane serine protease [Rhodobacterales bacterium]|nr:rhomboid family intramembrane serine protease [Rhodobacterales bacterium]